jgi:hypothetical protein
MRHLGGRLSAGILALMALASRDSATGCGSGETERAGLEARKIVSVHLEADGFGAIQEFAQLMQQAGASGRGGDLLTAAAVTRLYLLMAQTWERVSRVRGGGDGGGGGIWGSEQRAVVQELAATLAQKVERERVREERERERERETDRQTERETETVRERGRERREREVLHLMRHLRLYSYALTEQAEEQRMLRKY